MNRCIIVLGLPRSGTSAVAGTLHRLGVDMGNGYLQPQDALNERGYYEDLRWQRINKYIAGSQYHAIWPNEANGDATQAYRVLIEICNHKPLWGFKGPRVCFTLHYITPLLSEAGIDTHVVVVHRDFNAVVASMARHSTIAYGGAMRMSNSRARVLLNKWRAAFAWQVGRLDVPTVNIGYEDLMSDPHGEALRLAAFAFGGLPLEPNDIEESIEWIAPELKHC